MFDHVSLGVADMERSRRFYDAALAPLGLKRYQENDYGSGYGPSEEKADFWISLPWDKGKTARSGPGTHVAFTAADRDAVDAFHAAAMAAGGRDNGAPGLRPEYSPSYYGAFVLDPDGHNVEAVCHKPA